MRLILFDPPPDTRANFNPVALSRPVWQLRCGMTDLVTKLIDKLRPASHAGFVPPYMAAAIAERAGMPINDAASLAGDDLLLVNGCVKADSFAVPPAGPSEVGTAEDGEVLYARIAAADAAKLKTGSIDEFLASAVETLPGCPCDLPTWNYIWDLVLENPDEITREFSARACSGIEGTIEEPSAIRGDAKDVFVAAGTVIHPMVVIDAEHGPVYIDRDVEVHPFTRIEGPCYIGPKCQLLGAKCREGNSFGPVCRIGGEVEESIVQGYSNKYHDGFLGHAYVGEWVNLGALTTNSDLKNDYSNVSVYLDGKKGIDTGSTKVGALIGDHTKTSIGVLLNTGAYVGAMALLMATGQPLQKFIPSFSWLIEGFLSKGFGRKALYETAEKSMPRRGQQWTDAQREMWDAIFEMTAPVRDPILKKSRKAKARH